MKKIRHCDCFGSGNPGNVYPKQLCESYTVFDSTPVVKSGRFVRESALKVINPSDLMKGFCASDFSLENIQAAGALELLKPCQAHLNRMEIADMVDSSDSSMVDYLMRQNEISQINENSEKPE